MNVPKKITLPGDALTEQVNNDNKKLILNPIYEKKYLTINDVLNCINHFSAVLLADECYAGQEEHKRYL